MSSSSRSQNIRLLVVAVILTGGALLRFSYNNNTIILTPIRGDAAHYLAYAHNILNYSTFSKDRSSPPVPDSYWAPGYPLFLAAVTKGSDLIGINDYNAIRHAQLILGAATIFLCFLLSLRILPGYWATLPPLLVAFSPHLVSTASYILSETLFGFLISLSLYVLIRGIETNRKSLWFFAGLCFASTYLVNPVSVFLAPLLGFILLIYIRKESSRINMRRLFMFILMLLLPVIITVTGWSARNAISVPDSQPSSTDRLLANLIAGIYPDYHDAWRASIIEPDKNAAMPGEGVEKTFDGFSAELKRHVAEKPLQMLVWYAVQKPVDLWGWNIKVGQGEIYIYPVLYSLYTISVPARITYSLMWSLHFWLLGAGLMSIVFVIKERTEATRIVLLLYSCIVYLSLVYICTQADARYSIPLRSELYICAIFFLWMTYRFVGDFRRRSLQAPE